ncbi:MAG: hypothetical protein CUN55_10180 [Phototrophicales bacterium]|nr:MAG: hypothetical protein CUN55_10180 [Phototrophicales bacterium]
MSELDEYYQKMQANQGWVIILESFARFIAPQPEQLVLDIGTGPGALVNILATQHQARVYGVDYSFQLMRSARSNYANLGTVFVTGALPTLPFGDNTIDIATATNVLYLLDDPQSAVVEISRILKPNGQLVMLNPSPKMSVASATALANERNLTGFERENFIDWGQIAEDHVRWSIEDIKALFAPANLVIDEWRERIGDGLALYVRGIKQ